MVNVTQSKFKQTLAEWALSEITEAMRLYEKCRLTRLEALTKIGQTVSRYFDEINQPIPYQPTDKAGADDDQSPA